MTATANNELAAELRTAVTRLIKKMRSKASTAGELSLTERSTLAQINRQKEILPSELATLEKVTNQSMSQILNHLDELKLITRTPSATDGRKTIISLSKEGQKMVDKARNEKEEWLAKALEEVCTAKELEILHKVIVPLNKIVDYD